MAENVTDQLNYHSSILSIPLCENQPVKISTAGYIMAALNVLSVIINIGHIRVLSKIPSLKGSAYYHILIHLTIGDMLSAMSGFCYMTFNLQKYFLNWSPLVLTAYSTVIGSLFFARIGILFVAACERYYALCHPFSYSMSRFVTHLHCWLPLVWVIWLAIDALAIGIFQIETCYMHVVGPIVTGPKKFLFKVSGLSAISLITLSLLLRVVVELIRMRKRSLSSEEKTMKRSVYFVVAIIVLYYSSFSVTLIGSLVYSSTGQRAPILYYIEEMLVPTIYGLCNVVIYGWLMPAYRAVAYSVVTWGRCETRSAQVTPATQLTEF